MIRFLIDEDMPRSTAGVLKNAGFECIDVRDIGLRGPAMMQSFGGPKKKLASFLQKT